MWGEYSIGAVCNYSDQQPFLTNYQKSYYFSTAMSMTSCCDVTIRFHHDLHINKNLVFISLLYNHIVYDH